jgi:hypothetical protein
MMGKVLLFLEQRAMGTKVREHFREVWKCGDGIGVDESGVRID